MQREVDYNNDAYGDRIDKSLDATGGGTFVVTRFAYDGWKTGPQKSFVGNENRDVWPDLDGSNNLQTRYVRGDAIDQPLARIGSDTTAYWYLPDRMGSIRDVTDNSGVVKDTLGYHGWGAIVTETNSSFRGRNAWTGREMEKWYSDCGVSDGIQRVRTQLKPDFHRERKAAASIRCNRHIVRARRQGINIRCGIPSNRSTGHDAARCRKDTRRSAQRDY